MAAFPLKELCAENIHIANPEHVGHVINEMVKGGEDRLQIVADFDMTLSKYVHNGCRCDTSHGIIDESPYLSQSFQDLARANRIHYQAIEFDPSLSETEKLPHMVEWWTETHKLLVSQKVITRDMLCNMARQSNCILRDGYDWLFQTLQKKCVPLLIFSAGIGDLIQQIISAKHALTDDMKVVSNFMRFDENGLLQGFQDKIIHCLNKNELALENTQYFEKLQSRPNIILMGDSLGDLQMADGAHRARHVLKIGFLNKNVEESLPIYKESFDIVITEDGSLNVVNAILSSIVS